MTQATNKRDYGLRTKARRSMLLAMALIVIGVATITGCGGGDPDDEPAREPLPRCTIDHHKEPHLKSCVRAETDRQS